MAVQPSLTETRQLSQCVCGTCTPSPHLMLPYNGAGTFHTPVQLYSSSSFKTQDTKWNRKILGSSLVVGVSRLPTSMPASAVSVASLHTLVSGHPSVSYLLKWWDHGRDYLCFVSVQHLPKGALVCPWRSKEYANSILMTASKVKGVLMVWRPLEDCLSGREPLGQKRTVDMTQQQLALSHQSWIIHGGDQTACFGVMQQIHSRDENRTQISQTPALGLNQQNTLSPQCDSFQIIPKLWALFSRGKH